MLKYPVCKLPNKRLNKPLRTKRWCFFKSKRAKRAKRAKMAEKRIPMSIDMLRAVKRHIFFFKRNRMKRRKRKLTLFKSLRPGKVDEPGIYACWEPSNRAYLDNEAMLRLGNADVYINNFYIKKKKTYFDCQVFNSINYFLILN